jgi:hypothetical protein
VRFVIASVRSLGGGGRFFDVVVAFFATPQCGGRFAKRWCNAVVAWDAGALHTPRCFHNHHRHLATATASVGASTTMATRGGIATHTLP